MISFLIDALLELRDLRDSENGGMKTWICYV